MAGRKETKETSKHETITPSLPQHHQRNGSSSKITDDLPEQPKQNRTLSTSSDRSLPLQPVDERRKSRSDITRVDGNSREQRRSSHNHSRSPHRNGSRSTKLCRSTSSGSSRESEIHARQTSRTDLKRYEMRIIKRKVYRQFPSDISRKTTYSERKNRLENFVLPPMYGYTDTAGKFVKWMQELSDSGRKERKVKEEIEKHELPTKILNSKHFARILEIGKNRLLTACEPNSTNGLYYAILNLPGADESYNDQGYIGKVTGTQTFSERWRQHTGYSIIDQNLRFLQQYCESGGTIHEYAAIFLLGTAEKETVDTLETFYMCRDFCTGHGTLAVKCKPQHDKDSKCDCQSSSSKDCVVDCTCEKSCQDESCDAQCIRLTDMRYGMNNCNQGIVSTAQQVRTYSRTTEHFGDGKTLCVVKKLHQ